MVNCSACSGIIHRDELVSAAFTQEAQRNYFHKDCEGKAEYLSRWREEAPWAFKPVRLTVADWVTCSPKKHLGIWQSIFIARRDEDIWCPDCGLKIARHEGLTCTACGSHAIVVGVEATKMVFDFWRDMPLTENHIKQLHGALLRFSHRDEHHRGGYKMTPNNVEAFDEHGRSVGVIFETATPFDTPRLMEELVAWTNRELGGSSHHPLLVVAVFVVRFLAVHPFQDGNGRLARVLTNLLLARTGYTYVPYSSLERVVEENREQYYRALRSAQGTLDKDESHLMDWLRFFLLCLVEQKNSLAEKVKRERLMTSLSALDELLLQLAHQHGRLTLTAAQALTKANRNTLKLHLRGLVQAGRLQLLGRGRSSWYEAV